MSLSDVVSSGVETAFKVAADFVKLGTYYVMPDGSQSGDYDPVTDTVAGARQTINNVRMLRTKSQETEVEASAAATQRVKFLIPASDLPGVEPRTPDELLYNGIRYNVLTYAPVPGYSLLILETIRK